MRWALSEPLFTQSPHPGELGDATEPFQGGKAVRDVAAKVSHGGIFRGWMSDADVFVFENHPIAVARVNQHLHKIHQK